MFILLPQNFKSRHSVFELASDGLLIGGELLSVLFDQFFDVIEIALHDAVLLIEGGSLLRCVFLLEHLLKLLDAVDQPLVGPGEGGYDLLHLVYLEGEDLDLGRSLLVVENVVYLLEGLPA